MSKGRIFLIILLTILGAMVAFFVIGKKDLTLVSPVINPIFKQGPVVSSSPMPQTLSINAPKVIKYDSTTNLEQELESVNPQVSDSDFE
ncbi:MAG: hypothetical protein Q8P87_00705 [bacterium]|nr:hypothetical protein [bacterium]